MRIAALRTCPFRTVTGTLVLVLLFSLAMPAMASAHAFLVQSVPSAGQRLRVAPRRLTLAFTEPVVPDSVTVQVKTAAGTRIKAGPITLGGGGSIVAVRLPALSPGVYLVDWQVVSAQDGHFTAGEFAFAVGPATSTPLRGLRTSTSQPVDWPDALANWLLLLGLALALGSVVNELLLGPRSGTGLKGCTFANQTVLRVSFATALVGSGGSLALFVGSLGKGDVFLTWFRAHVWMEALGAPAGMLAADAFVLVVYAALCAWRGSRKVPVLTALLLASLSVAMRTHPVSGGSWWASLAIAVHVTVAVLWVGMLASLVLALWRERRLLPQTEMFAAIVLYARLALFSVLVVLASGAVAALSQFRSLGQLISTPYGRVLLGKTALTLVVLSLAQLSRRHVVRRTESGSTAVVRSAMRFEAMLLVLVLGLASLLANTAPPPPAVSAGTLDTLLGPPSPSGPALTLAGQAGWLEVFITASLGHLTVRVVSPESTHPSGVHLISADTPTADAVFAEPPSDPRGPIGLSLRPCGPGCFIAPFRWHPGVTRLHLEVAAKGWSGGNLSFAVPWPPRAMTPADWAEIISTLSLTQRITVNERVVSGPHASAHRTYRFTGHEWLRSEPYPRTAADIHLLRQGPLGSSFVALLPGSLIWMHVWVDAEHRITRQVTVDQGHLIIDSITYGKEGR